LLGAAVLLNCPALLAQSSPLPTITAVSPATNAPLAGANDVITITVSPANPGGSTPTGTVAVTVDTTSANASIPLANGAASYTFSASSGSHVITAYYSGDQTYAASIGTVTVSIVHKTFVISATSPTVTAGTAAVSTVTITPLHGYTGTVTFTVGSNSQTQVPCFSAPDTVINGTTPVTASLTMQTKASACPKVGRLTLQDGVIAAATSLVSRRGDDSKLPPGSAALALGVFAALGLFVRKRSIMFALPLLALVALAGCGSSSGSSNVPVGAYSVIISAVDKQANVAATTTIILTVQ